MFTEELNLIRKAEEEADALKKNSVQEAKKMVQEANETAAKLIADAEESAKERYETLNSEGQTIADKEYDDAISAVQSEAEELEKKALLKKDEVVQFIAERIVSISVNS